MKKKNEIITEKINQRIDIFLVNESLVPSRNKAKEMIERGMITLNGIVVKKTNATVLPADKIELINSLKFVGRGGEKIEEGFIKWNVNLTGKIVLDIGSSTGGFTDASLIRGASKVYAIDVGHDQLDSKLKNDSRVISMEGTDIRNVSTLPELGDLAIIDVSFISLASVFPTVSKLLKNSGEIIALVKPQFEVGYGKTKKGIVKDINDQTSALEEVRKSAESIGFTFVDLIDSPIKGKHGNKEFLMYLKRSM